MSHAFANGYAWDAMAKIPVALQLYSVRDDASKDLIGTIRKVAEFGYDGVEFAGYHGNSAEDIKAVLDETGLKPYGAHVGLGEFTDEKFDATVAFHKTVGINWLIVPWIPTEKHNTIEATEATAAEFTVLVEKLKAHGLRTGFHAHAGDMHKLPDGRTAWDVLAANTPADFILQYDTCNGKMGGADPVQPIRDWPGRNQSLHLKEYTPKNDAVLGEGEIPWAEVIEAAENGGGVEVYVIEHESEMELPPIEAVAKARENLRKFGR